MYVIMYLCKVSYLDRPTKFYLTTSSGFIHIDIHKFIVTNKTITE